MAHWHYNFLVATERWITDYWMNTLFVFRRLFSKTQFFARNPSQGYIFGLDNRRNIFQPLRSLEWGLEHFSKSIIFVGIKTMSADNAENSTILENLRKSLKEQVCSESYSMFKRKILNCSTIALVGYTSLVT